jgi:hypothetical protein
VPAKGEQQCSMDASVRVRPHAVMRCSARCTGIEGSCSSHWHACLVSTPVRLCTTCGPLGGSGCSGPSAIRSTHTHVSRALQRRVLILQTQPTVRPLSPDNCRTPRTPYSSKAHEDSTWPGVARECSCA